MKSHIELRRVPVEAGLLKKVVIRLVFEDERFGEVDFTSWPMRFHEAEYRLIRIADDFHLEREYLHITEEPK